MSEIVEKLARALYATDCALDPIEPREPDWGRGGFKTEVIRWNALARAVLSTLADNLTPDMVEAAQRASDYQDHLGPPTKRSLQAALTAALRSAVGE